MKASRPRPVISAPGGTWFNEFASSAEQTAPLSVNETLARAMTVRFIGEMRERSWRCRTRHEPPTVEKRAAAYRAGRRWIEQSVPSDLMILADSIGPHDGKAKEARCIYMYWNVAQDTQRLMALASRIEARKLGFLECAVAIVSEHALNRLFQRLNTIDYRAVLRELNAGIDALFRRFVELTRANISPVLAPTPLGALVFCATPPEKEKVPFVAVTWVSDERMRDSRFKLAAVEEARAERGVLGVVGERFMVISAERLARAQELSPDQERQLWPLFRPSADLGGEASRRPAKP